VSHAISLQWEHRLFFTRDVFAPENSTLFDAMREHFSAMEIVPRVVVFVDAGLLASRAGLLSAIEAWAQRHGEFLKFMGPPMVVPGGEGAKNDPRILEQIYADIAHAELCRHSFVIVVGGGAVLDAVGFAAATAHRGIPLIRIPTTSLAQGDGGVGVKNGVNRHGRKNWLGAFTVPFAVINDAAFLDSLPARERRAGLIEALKVTLIRDAEFLDEIEARAEALAAFEPAAFEAAIERSARIHLEHIATGGDPFEGGSSRPLDFGHWAAHKLEQISDFQLGHGEAVALGMAVDLTYAAEIGLLPAAQCERFVRLIERFGFPTFSPWLDDPQLIGGLEEFREHLGGKLTIPMIREAGQRVDLHEMDGAVIARAIGQLRDRQRCASEA
jgi:3-dehydroquinate synthase